MNKIITHPQGHNMSSEVATYSICPKILYVVYVLHLEGMANPDLSIKLPF